MNDISPTGIYSADDVAELFGVQVRVIWRLFNDGEIPARQIGRRWFTTGECILTYIREAANQHVSDMSGNQGKPATAHETHITDISTTAILPTKATDSERERLKQTMLALYQEAGSYAAAAELANERGIKTVSGKGKWAKQSVMKLLKG